jgi:hypothetical protein
MEYKGYQIYRKVVPNSDYRVRNGAGRVLFRNREEVDSYWGRNSEDGYITPEFKDLKKLKKAIDLITITESVL